MRVQSKTELDTFQDWTLRVRPAALRPARLLLLIHGWTGDENSMWVFARNLPANYWIVAPRAPYPAQPSGFSWRAQQRGEHERPTLENLRPAVGSLISLVDAYAAENQMDAAQFDAMGFSQGAVLTCSLALLHPGRTRRLGVLSGFVPEGAEALVEGRPLDGRQVFMAHGTLDPTVPVEVARRSRGLLERAGAQVTYCEDEVGHKLGVKCLHSLEAFFA